MLPLHKRSRHSVIIPERADLLARIPRQLDGAPNLGKDTTQERHAQGDPKRDDEQREQSVYDRASLREHLREI